MNARIAGTLLIALAALTVSLAACGGGSGNDKTKAAAGTPQAGTTALASAPAGKTAGATSTGNTPGAGSAGQTPGASTSVNQTPDATSSASVAGATASPGAPQADITVNAQGTATNSLGTPVPLPTQGSASASATPPAGASPEPSPTASAAGGPPRIFIDAPSSASGDFTVSVRIDNVSDAYHVFTIAIKYDPAIVKATTSAAGTALASSPDDMFCIRPPEPGPGLAHIACTILGESLSTNNGVLATFNFSRVGSGTVSLHLQSYAEVGADGTYTATSTRQDVTLTDATVTVS
jgi:hypothetical protein